MDSLYDNLYSNLLTNTKIIVFIKKDNNFRVMLCTKNNDTINLACGIGSLDANSRIVAKESSKNRLNGYLSVFDLEACDSRLVNTNKVVETYNLDTVDTADELNKAFELLHELKQKYDKFNEVLDYDKSNQVLE